MANAVLEIQIILQGRLKLRPEECLVFLAVIAATVQRFARSATPDSDHLTREPIPPELRSSISRRRLSDSLGIPLETVRRHIARLKERGLVVEHGRGQLSSSGGTLRIMGDSGDTRRIASQFTGVTNSFLKLGVLQTTPARD